MIELSDISFVELTLYGLSVVSAGVLGVRWGSKKKGANDINFQSLLSSVKAPTTVNKPDKALVKAWIIGLHAAVHKNWNHADLPPIRDIYHCTVDYPTSFCGFIDQLVSKNSSVFIVNQDCFEFAPNNRPKQLKEVEETFKRYAQAASFEDAVDAYRMMVYGDMLASTDSLLDDDELANTEIVAIQKTESKIHRVAVALLYTEDNPTPFRLIIIRYSTYGPVQSLYLTQFSTKYGGTTTTSITNKTKSTWYRRFFAS